MNLIREVTPKLIAVDLQIIRQLEQHPKSTLTDLFYRCSHLCQISFFRERLNVFEMARLIEIAKIRTNLYSISIIDHTRIREHKKQLLEELEKLPKTQWALADDLIENCVMPEPEGASK
jgi:hypothetical protein